MGAGVGSVSEVDCRDGSIPVAVRFHSSPRTWVKAVSLRLKAAVFPPIQVCIQSMLDCWRTCRDSAAKAACFSRTEENFSESAACVLCL